MPKILITGASGFVGRNVKEYLQKNDRNYDIYTPSSKELNCIEETETLQYLKAHRFDYILHFASYGDSIDKSKDGSKIFEYNMRIFLNFYKNSHLFSRMYYSGSGAEYDKRFDIANVAETDLGKSLPTDQYGLMKYTIGELIEKSDNVYNFRLFGIFGKYEYYPVKFISNICCKAIKNLPLSIRQNVYFDYIWVEDFCRIIEYFLHHAPTRHTYNAVSGKKISLEKLCRLVLKISGKELPIYICKEGLAKEYTASNARLMEELTGFEYTPIEDSVRQLYQWYLEHEDEIDLFQLLY
ncbi:MAG: NAD(P)-dependent oxidoreductase [Eubacterium sp.]|jgi:nucleoside-diphosphate-sugar epimerase|nr:NAD(P)-dependent oxidoreductase [Eubacterium sp.]